MPPTRVWGHCARTEWHLAPGPAHQLPQNDGKNLSTSLKGAPHPCLFRQHDGGSLYKTPSRRTHGPSTAGVHKLFHSTTHLDNYNLFHDPPKYLRYLSLILIKSFIWQNLSI